MPHNRQEGHCHLQGDLAIEEGSAEFQVLPSGTIAVETASGREGIILKRLTNRFFFFQLSVKAKGVMT